MWSITSSFRVGERQDRHPALRHHPRRPAAQLHQCRADQPRFLHLHRRLGVPGPARRRRAEADPDRAAGDRRALPARRRRRRQGRAAGQQPVDHAHRRPGHAARLRQRALGSAAADAVGPGADADRLRPRRRLSYRRCGKHDRADLSRHRRLAHARRSAPSPPICKWPFVGPLFGGIQRLVPRVQLVLTPPTPNLDIPNEDARSVDLEDSNLFALNRFPGYDRWEDASRVTYGVDWSLERPNLSIDEHDRPELSDLKRDRRFSRRYRADRPLSPTSSAERASATGGFIDLTHRYRVDKDNFAVRRNEIDLTVGTDADLCPDRLSAAQPQHRSGDRGFARQGRAAPRRRGSCSAATGRSSERPSSTSPTRAKIRCRWPTGSSRCATASASQYEDECLELGLTWRRDYEHIGDFRKGSTFALHLALKGLGR